MIPFERIRDDVKGDGSLGRVCHNIVAAEMETTNRLKTIKAKYAKISDIDEREIGMRQNDLRRTETVTVVILFAGSRAVVSIFRAELVHLEINAHIIDIYQLLCIRPGSRTVGSTGKLLVEPTGK